MKVELISWSKNVGWDKKAELSNAGLVIYFGGKGLLDSGECYHNLKKLYPQAHLIGCSTGGEIYGADVRDSTVASAALSFTNTPLRVTSVPISDSSASFAAGETVAKALNKADLRYILLLSDGTNVNGSDLIRGIYNILDEKVIVTGGLAGDAADFQKTFVGIDGPPQEKLIAAVGFYGDAIQIGYGSVGGWLPFGPERKITKSKGNILYELDGKPALELYKKYLGDNAAKLPGSALLFPLCIRPQHGSEHDIVRTIIGVDEKEQAMIFAGDIPEGYTAQLMQGNFDDLVDGATKAAELANKESQNQDSLAVLVSCIGRKLLLGQSISDETEAVAEAFQHRIPTIGFYSYGEVCHQQFTGKCSLHNQTMTVTVIHEKS